MSCIALCPEDVNVVWHDTITDLCRFYDYETQPRGQRTREILGHLVKVDMTRPVLTIPERRMGYKFMCAEAAWILDGDDRVETLAPYGPMVARFSDDGKTFWGAYGPRVRDQLVHVCRALTEDCDTRQAVITIWRPNPPATRDVPCTVSLQFVNRDDRLHTFVNMRSSDVWLGLPYDVFSMTMLSATVALLTGIRRLGTLYQYAGSRHLYERNFERAETVVRESRPCSSPSFDVSRFDCAAHLREYLWLMARGEFDHGGFLTELMKKRYEEKLG